MFLVKLCCELVLARLRQGLYLLGDLFVASRCPLLDLFLLDFRRLPFH